MNKEFVPYQESLELRELGFDEPCFATYEFRKLFIGEFHNSLSFDLCKKTEVFPAPTFSQSFRWFREKYELNHEIPYAGRKGEYHAFVNNYIYGNNGNSPSVFPYEEAELACLRKLIEIVKQKV